MFFQPPVVAVALRKHVGSFKVVIIMGLGESFQGVIFMHCFYVESVDSI